MLSEGERQGGYRWLGRLTKRRLRFAVTSAPESSLSSYRAGASKGVI